MTPQQHLDFSGPPPRTPGGRSQERWDRTHRTPDPEPPALDVWDPVVAQVLAAEAAKQARHAAARTLYNPATTRRLGAKGRVGSRSPVADWTIRWRAIACQHLAHLTAAHARQVTAALRPPAGVTFEPGTPGQGPTPAIAVAVRQGGVTTATIRWRPARPAETNSRGRQTAPATAQRLELTTGPAGVSHQLDTTDGLRDLAAALTTIANHIDLEAAG